MDSSTANHDSDALPLSVIVSRLNSSQLSAQMAASQHRRSGALDNCTYQQGYQDQLVFICLTCRVRQPHGFCLACSMNCHLSHDVIEIGKKRSFRCDCCTDRIKHQCQLNSSSTNQDNNDNVYGQNFLGLFCHCSSPYDPEVETRDMIMCCRCQDWFHYHPDCIGSAAEADIDRRAFLCRSCVQTAPLLALYGRALEVKGSVEGHCTKPRDPSDESRCQGMFIADDVASRMCQCDSCSVEIVDQGLQFVFSRDDGDETDDDSEDHHTEAELSPEFDPGLMLDRALSVLPREAAIEGAMKFRRFTDGIIQGLRQVMDGQNDHVITVEDVNNICQNILGKRNRE
uniref:UBR-type domain-containing protein n=1 Tax=Spongospora subterranea TaxID=70186 RepID=A0A0H5RMS7_9EUKA|eukprot:CRZ10029.1 hypothetical protein [Spongospora subterranea]